MERKAFERGVQDAFEYLNRYYTTNWRQVTGRANLEIEMRRAPSNWPSWYNITAYYYMGQNRMVFGPDIQGNPDSIRRTTMHEMMHHYGFNYHPWQQQFRGNRVVDIGGRDADFTELDERLLATKGVRRRPNTPSPREDEAWWRYRWTNWNNQYDVNNDGVISSRDALNVFNALQRGVKFDLLVTPKMFYDVNMDERVSSTDALVILNRLRNETRGYTDSSNREHSIECRCRTRSQPTYKFRCR